MFVTMLLSHIERRPLLPYKSDGDVSRKIRIKSLKQTNLGVAHALFTPMEYDSICIFCLDISPCTTLGSDNGKKDLHFVLNSLNEAKRCQEIIN